ncbi:MAG: hypothetical protein K2Q01_04015 [Rickettsiales bacterium]|nr:hypothetical protein [Rickettsiales bacterium]
MISHTIYTELLACIDRSACASLTRAELKRQVLFLINEIASRQGCELPRWEQQLLTRQLLHDMPNADRLGA